MTIHYELILLYAIGMSPKQVIGLGLFSRGTAYRFHRIYREARKRAVDCIISGNSVSPRRERKAKNLDQGRKKKGRPPAEKKPVLIRRDDGEYDRVML